jgi:hypothetical protein
MESLISDIPAVDGKFDNLFYSVDSTIRLSCTQGKHDLLSHIHDKLTPQHPPLYLGEQIYNESLGTFIQYKPLYRCLNTIFYSTQFSWSGHARCLLFNV